MFKFFRNLRRRLLAQNKFTSYLLYAVGEIVLVVIGILIALQINTWNLERIESKKEEGYIENIIRDLQSQLASIDLQLEYEQKYVDLGTILLEEYGDTDAIVLDSISCKQLGSLTERKTFVRIDPTFEDMISTGNIGLLKNQDVRNGLIEYYQELKRVEKVVQNNNTLHVDHGFALKVTDLVAVGQHVPDRSILVSNELLKDSEREMRIITLVDFRKSIAQSHINFINELRVKTEELIVRLERIHA